MVQVKRYSWLFFKDALEELILKLLDLKVIRTEEKNFVYI